METGVAVTLIRKFSSILLPLISFYTAIACAATPVAPPTPAETVRAVLSAPDTALNYMTAKLTFDRIIKPSVDDSAITAQIAAPASEASAIAGASASDVDKLKAVRQVLYDPGSWNGRSEEHTSELQSLMRISYAVFCLKKKKNKR